MRNSHPIVQSLQKQMEEEAKQKAVREAKERFIPERWHIVSLLIALSLISAIFRAQIIWVSFFLGGCLGLDTFLEFKIKSMPSARGVSENKDVISDIGDSL